MRMLMQRCRLAISSCECVIYEIVQEIKVFWRLSIFSNSKTCRRMQLANQYVALTGRNGTGPPCCVGRPSRPPTALQTTTDDRRRRQMTDASEQNNTGPLGGPVIVFSGFLRRKIFDAGGWRWLAFSLCLNKLLPGVRIQDWFLMINTLASPLDAIIHRTKDRTVGWTGLMNWSVSQYRSSTVSRARCAGAFLYKIRSSTITERPARRSLLVEILSYCCTYNANRSHISLRDTFSNCHVFFRYLHSFVYASLQ